MDHENKRILMIDEQGFYRVCSAILEAEGYSTELFTSVVNLPVKLNNKEFGLIVISYPFGAFLIDEIKKWNIATIVLTDTIDGDLITQLKGLENSYCMIKPIDYAKFGSLIQEVMSGDAAYQRGYNVV